MSAREFDWNPRPPGSCKHRPISNGWSSGWSAEHGPRPPASYCGYCEAVIQLDDEWLAKFAATGRPVSVYDPTA